MISSGTVGPSAHELFTLLNSNVLVSLKKSRAGKVLVLYIVNLGLIPSSYHMVP